MEILERKKVKTVWRERERKLWTFYCPLCRGERALPFRPTPGSARHILQVASTTAFFTLLTWQWFGLKGLISFVPIWGLFELAYRARARAVLACPSCGFDPFLTLVDVKKARAQVERHWQAKLAEKEKRANAPGQPSAGGSARQ